MMITSPDMNQTNSALLMLPRFARCFNSPDVPFGLNDKVSPSSGFGMDWVLVSFD
jgi:hypothetical protein